MLIRLSIFVLLMLLSTFTLDSTAFGGELSKSSKESVVEEKSELVRTLESVFYGSEFAKIPQKIFLAENFGVKADGKTVNTKRASMYKRYSAAAGSSVSKKDMVEVYTGNLPSELNNLMSIGEIL